MNIESIESARAWSLLAGEQTKDDSHLFDKQTLENERSGKPDTEANIVPNMLAIDEEFRRRLLFGNQSAGTPDPPKLNMPYRASIMSTGVGVFQGGRAIVELLEKPQALPNLHDRVQLDRLYDSLPVYKADFCIDTNNVADGTDTNGFIINSKNKIC